MTSEALLGAASLPFAGMTLLFAGAALAMGRALAANWRPAWQILPYGLLLAAFHRFLLYALYDGALDSASGYALAALALMLFVLLAYRVTQVRLMVRQYPWLYRRAGPFAWRGVDHTFPP